jgi:hypothetical protein
MIEFEIELTKEWIIFFIIMAVFGLTVCGVIAAGTIYGHSGNEVKITFNGTNTTLQSAIDSGQFIGIKGPTGPQGPRGPQGPQGAQGGCVSCDCGGGGS